MAKFFIDRPIVAIVISIVMVIVGVVSMLQLPTAQFPNIAPPEIQVTAIYPGANAQTLEQAVATPIEQQLSGVDNMNYMYSTNANNGQTQITVDFGVQTDPNIDQVLTQLRVAQATSQLPPEVNTAGVTVQKSFSAPLMLVDLYSPNSSYDNVFLANYAYINLVDQLTRVPGIAKVLVFGAGQYAMRIWVQPDKLAKLQVTVPQIIQAIQIQNTVNPAGKVGGEPVPQGQQFTYTVRAQGRLVSAEEFGEIIIRANPDGSNLRLKDVARLELGAQTYDVVGRYNGKPSAILALYQLPGANAVQAAKGVRTAMEALKKRFPADLDYKVGLDTTLAVSAGIKEIVKTLFEALLLVIIVVYIFLQGWRATLIPLLAVPVSLVGTFAVFPILGFSINTLSLFGLVLAIGLVVDDAIVVTEAVEHHIEEGMTPRDAALKAMEEVSGPVVAIALILVAVFVPTIFIPAIRGDHCDLGRFLGVQRLVAQPSALCPAAPAQNRKPRPTSAVLQMVQPGFWTRDRRFREFQRHVYSQSGIDFPVPGRGRGLHGFIGKISAHLIFAGRRSRLFVRGYGAARCGVAAAQRRRRQESGRHPAENAGSGRRDQRGGVQPAEFHAEYVQHIFLRDAEGLGCAQSERRTISGHSTKCGRGAGPTERSNRVLVSATGYSGCRFGGWRNVRARRPVRQRSRIPGRERE